MKFVAGLACHLCGKRYAAEASWVCECLGPLEVTYDYAAIKQNVSRAKITARPRGMSLFNSFGRQRTLCSSARRASGRASMCRASN